jgi:glycosyltransferase involved in cell wall biosynthesis
VRVLLDTTYASRAPYSGTAVYLERVADALSGLDDVELLEVGNHRRRPPAGGGWGSVRNAVVDQWWTEVELPRLARSMAVEVIHHPLPALSRTSRTPQVVTVHDLAFERVPKAFAPAFRGYARLAHRAAARAADAVICVSQSTARDVRSRWGVKAERLVVAPHGPGQELPPSGPGDRSHFLYVGDDEPRKNLAVLLDAYRRYRASSLEPLGLILAGNASAAGAGVRREHHPDPERLAHLYADAVALVHPALYEGFGMTPLEAMRLGTPVIVAATPALREVCGSAARYVDPHDPQALAAAMLELAQDPVLRGQLADRGRGQAARFSWAASARRHRDAYSLATRP